MKSFNIKEYNKYKINTKSGKDVRIICKDRLDSKTNGTIVALVSNKAHTYEQVVLYTKDGKQINYASEFDLVMNDEQ